MPSTSTRFLKQLYRGLKWRISQDEAEDIVRDYLEYFDEEQKRNKSEAEIIEALGAPRQVIKTIMGERKLSIRSALYWPCLALAVIATLFFPVIELWPDLHSLLWEFLSSTPTAYVITFLAPLPSLYYYILQHPHSHSASSKFHARLLYGAAGLSFLIFSVSSLIMFWFCKELYAPRFNVESPLILFVYYPQLFASLFAAFAWLLGIFLSDKCGCRFPIFYFLYAAIQVSMCHFSSILSGMNFEDNSMPFERFAKQVFIPIAEIFLCAIAGAALWCVFQHFFRKKGEK